LLFVFMIPCSTIQVVAREIMTDWVDAGETSNSRKPSRHGFPTLPNNERQNRESRNRVCPLDAESWSPDGRAIAYTASGIEVPPSIMVVSFEGGRPAQPFNPTKFAQGSPKLSPDGRWLAYCSNESGKPQVYVQAYPGPGPKIQVSTDGGTDPVWKRTAGELYCRNSDSMMAVDVDYPNIRGRCQPCASIPIVLAYPLHREFEALLVSAFGHEVEELVSAVQRLPVPKSSDTRPSGETRRNLWAVTPFMLLSLRAWRAGWRP
jgi:hypothetical protein